MTINRWEVPSKDLRAHFDSDRFPFKSTEELVPQDAVIGQERAAFRYPDRSRNRHYGRVSAGRDLSSRNNQRGRHERLTDMAEKLRAMEAERHGFSRVSSRTTSDENTLD
jgi:hypothetical protein